MDATQSQPRPAPNLLVRVVTARDEKIPAQNYHIEVRNENGEGIPGESVQGASYGAEMSGTYSGMPGLGMYGGSNGSTFSGDGRFIRQWVPGPRPQPVSYSEVPPGRYTAIVEFPDGRVGRQRFAVLPKQTRTVTVVCPEPLEPSLVTLVGPKQESVDPAYEIRVGVSIRRKDEKLGQTDWSVKEETAWDVWFDPKTGLATTLQTPIEPKGRRGSAQMITFDEDDPADTRFVSLKSGPYELTWKFLLVWQDKSKAGLDLSNPANMPPIESPKELHTAQAGSTTWTLTVPEALWSQVKNRAQGFSPRESGLPRSGQSNLVQIQWTTPAGLRLISRSGENDFEVLPAVPGRWHLQSGRAYELALTGIPDHPEETWNLDLELPELADHWRNFLAQNAIPFTLTDDDIEAVLNRQVLVKVAYLKGPPEDGNAAPVVETIVSTRLDPSADPVEEANKRGTVLAVWKISAPATTKPTDASNPANHD